MKTNKNQTGRKCDYCPSKDASPLTLKNLTVVSSCEQCYEAGAFKAAKPTHTPGPWESIQMCGTSRVQTAGRTWVATMNPNTPEGECGGVEYQECLDRAHANARLIAAAPNMLTALENAREALILLKSREAYRWTFREQDALNECYAAILRATEGK